MAAVAIWTIGWSRPLLRWKHGGLQPPRRNGFITRHTLPPDTPQPIFVQVPQRVELKPLSLGAIVTLTDPVTLSFEIKSEV